MKTNKGKTIEHFVTQYRAMLEENKDDYVANFESNMLVNNKA